MTGVWLQDSGRSGKARWTEALLGRGEVAGFVISPFATPKFARPRRPSADDLVATVTDAGGSVLFDPATHAASWPSTNDWGIYDTWDFWAGPRGDLSSRDRRAAHVLLTIEEQVRLGVSPTAPTLALNSALGTDADRAYEMADIARSQGLGVWLAIIGSASFWSQGLLLDDYVGQIAQLRPSGVQLAVTRTDLGYPSQALTAEISGICRTVFSLAGRCEVGVQYSDLFGLPALAAGASFVGSGWDLRQRVLAPNAYMQNTTTQRASKRITHRGLLGVLKRPEAERLRAADRPLSARLVPGALPADGNGLWEHHLTVLNEVTTDVLAVATARDRTDLLRRRYLSARAEFTLAEAAGRPLEAGPSRWLASVMAGLDAFAAAEGW